MNKAELVKQVASSANIKRDDANLALDAMTNAIIDTVKNGDKVTLIGFGTFLPLERKAREGRNPRTGEPIQIPAARVPKFVAGSAFKEAVNENFKAQQEAEKEALRVQQEAEEKAKKAKEKKTKKKTTTKKKI